MHCVAKDILFDDCIFTLGYYLTLKGDGDEEHIFPSFRYFVLDKDLKPDSKIATGFEKSWSEIYTKVAQYIKDIEELGNTLDEMSAFDGGNIAKKLVVHSAKQYCIQLLGDLLTMSVHDISMKWGGGWALKSLLATEFSFRCFMFLTHCSYLHIFFKL